jgi:hypothetical protein
MFAAEYWCAISLWRKPTARIVRIKTDIVLQFSRHQGSGYKSAVPIPFLPRMFDLAFSIYP